MPPDSGVRAVYLRVVKDNLDMLGAHGSRSRRRLTNTWQLDPGDFGGSANYSAVLLTTWNCRRFRDQLLLAARAWLYCEGPDRRKPNQFSWNLSGFS